MAAGLAVTGTDGGPGERRVLGVRILDLSRAEAFAALTCALSAGRHLKVAFCNAHTANTAHANPAFRRALEEFLVLPDGLGVDIAARWLSGRPFRSNLNGTDFVPEFLCAAQRPLRIALIGARPGVAERAAAVLSALGPGHRVTAVLDGYSPPAAQQRWLRALESDPVDLLLVAMGNPKQELWISRHVTGRHAVLAMGVGALMDFLAGEVRRAPALVRRMRLEWAWRLMLEPRRLFRRYVIGNPIFLLHVLSARRTQRRPW